MSLLIQTVLETSLFEQSVALVLTIKLSAESRKTKRSC